MSPQAFGNLAIKHLKALEAIDQFEDCCGPRREGEQNIGLTCILIPDPWDNQLPAVMLTCASCGYSRTHLVKELGLLDAWESTKW